MLCQERPRIPHRTGYFDILMRINLAPLLDHVMHQVLIMHHVLITHYAPIMHRAFSVGEEEGWNKRHIGSVVWWFNFFLDLINCFFFHSQVAASEHSCYQTVVVFNGQQLLLGVKVDQFSELLNIKKKGIPWNAKVYFQDFAAQLVT